jgi:uncharacterized protein
LHGHFVVQDCVMAKLREPGLDEILAFCAEDPVERVFLEDVARRGTGRFTAAAADGRLTALCYAGSNLVPSGEDCGVFADLAVSSGTRMIIGDEQAVTALWDAAASAMPTPREDRPGQPVYVIHDQPEPAESGLRAATEGDFDVLLGACAAAHQHELGIDPLERDPDGFRWRTRSQIAEGRSWLWRDGGTILFKAEASAWTPHAIQLQQVWTDPGARGRGYAQRGLRDLIRLLLRYVPTVCLFVRRENEAAIRLYDAVGMRRTISYRSLIF